MKKLLAILMIVLLMLSLTGCFGIGTTTTASTSSATSDEPTAEPTEPLKQEAYVQSFKGLQQYLIDRELISKDQKSDVYYDILGAADGARYMLSNTAFIELYDFTDASSDTAKAVLADIKDDGKFYAIEGYSELTGVISKSGKYVAVYNDKNGYEYNKITDELDKW